MGCPIITRESQAYYERVSSAFSQKDTTPELCGYYGRACRQMEKAEGANRALCFGCPLVEMQETLDNKFCTRVEALSHVETTSDAQKRAIQVAIGALKAAGESRERIVSFAEYQNNYGMPLSEAFHALADIPAPSTDSALQDALRAASDAIEVADLCGKNL